jgi:hypothetical protein
VLESELALLRGGNIALNELGDSSAAGVRSAFNDCIYSVSCTAAAAAVSAAASAAAAAAAIFAAAVPLLHGL